MDYEEFIQKLQGIARSANEDGFILPCTVDAVIVEYTIKLESLQEANNG